MRVAILSDIHFPYENPQAWKLTLKILRLLHPEKILLLGDLFDFEPISRFVVHPHKRVEFQSQILYSQKRLLELRNHTPNARINLLDGNHEKRMQTYLYTKAPELHDLDALTIPELFKLKTFDIQHLPWGTRQSIGKLNFCHGDEIRVGGVAPARNLYQKVSTNLLTGHFHRIDRYIHRQYNGEVYGVWTNGCLCTLDPQWTILPQWQLGMSVVDFTKSGFFAVDQLLYMQEQKKLHCMVHGQLVSV